MIPKYKIGDTVKFELENETVTAKIHWIDENGTFPFPDEVCYDVVGSSEGVETLFKHIPESMIL